MEAKQELEQVKQDITTLVSKMPTTVTTRAESEAAKQAVVVITKERKKREKWFKEEILAHSKKAYDEAKAAHEAQKAVLKELLAPFVAFEEDMNFNILRFENEELVRVRKANEEEARKHREAQAKAREEGKPATMVTPCLQAVAPSKTKRMPTGTYSLTTRKELVIVDMDLIPEEYWIRTLDEKRIESELRGGGTVAGCLLEDRLGKAVR